MNVKDVMLPLDRFPIIGKTVMLKEALDVMNNLRLGIACIVDGNNKLLGILTDGDIRRKLIKVQKPLSALFVDDALDHAIKSPITSKPEDTLDQAIEVMESKKIWDLPVIDNQGTLLGMLHLHPVVEALLKEKKNS
jgi:DeoR family transcriptional regulator, catabolite repression regulator